MKKKAAQNRLQQAVREFSKTTEKYYCIQNYPPAKKNELPDKNIWELCPCCMGEKKVQERVTEGTAINYITCHICNGWGIINKKSGKPPDN